MRARSPNHSPNPDHVWSVEHIAGDVAEIHDRVPVPDLGPTVWVTQVRSTTLVLGSTQSTDIVDHDECRSAGVDVVRRRSGGGAVLLVPGDVLWIDVIQPVGHAAWDHDVVRSAWWLGDAWAGALADVGVVDASVHHGGIVATRLSPTVCFAGMGPGEVMIDGRKLVGISQRRTRTHARFQCAIHHVWRPASIVPLLRDADESWIVELTRATTTTDVSDDEMITALVARLDAV
jgi:lipoate---protein ligase